MKMKKTFKPSRVMAADAQDPRERYKQRRENARAKKAAAKQDLVDKISECRDAEDTIEALFELLVPGSGKADTQAGELVRAMMKILYRDYNDGDLFYEGYGIETCGEAVAFLCDKIPELEDKFDRIAGRTLKDDAYTKAIKEIADDVCDYIFDELPEIADSNSDDYLKWNGREFIEDHDWEPSYEIDLDLPDNVYMHIEEGDISARDVEWEIEGWMSWQKDARIDVGNGWVNISDITADEYAELEDVGYKWLEQYGDDLDDEYGTHDEDEEDEEDEEEE